MELTGLLDEGRWGDAVALFMRTIGLPDAMTSAMRTAPTWSGAESLVPTLAYDAEIMSDSKVPIDIASSVQAPTLVLDGSETGAWAANAARALSETLPNTARSRGRITPSPWTCWPPR